MTTASTIERRALLDAVDRGTDPLKPASQRLLSLDVFRGLVILAMLVVNNLGDHATTGFFWKHADWPEPWLAESFRQWWEGIRSGALSPLAAFAAFPVFRHCTLADYVMPSFLLIIGLAIPYSVAASLKRGIAPRTMWLRTVRRAFLLVLLGWILCYFRDQFAASLYGQRPWAVTLGMDVLQLLGVSYLVARVGYELSARRRLVLAGALLVWHWAFLRFWPQGDVPAGTFTAKHNAVGYAYQTWGVWSYDLLGWMNDAWRGRLTLSLAGLLSVPPTAATVLLGTLAGDLLRRTDLSDVAKIRRLALWSLASAAVGLLWAFDLPFNKPRWTGSYLLWCTGVGFVALAVLYWLIDLRGRRGWTLPFVVLGSNAIVAYFLPILTKVLIGNTPRVTYAGETTSLTNASILFLKHHLGTWAGGWAFTLLFVAFWWAVLAWMHRQRLFLKL